MGFSGVGVSLGRVCRPDKYFQSKWLSGGDDQQLSGLGPTEAVSGVSVTREPGVGRDQSA